MSSPLRHPDGRFDITEITRLLGADPPAFSAHERCSLAADLSGMNNPLAAFAIVVRRLGGPHLFVKYAHAEACLLDVLAGRLEITRLSITLDDISAEECLEIHWLDGPESAAALSAITEHLGGAFVPDTSLSPSRVVLKPNNDLHVAHRSIHREKGDFAIHFDEGVDNFRLRRRISKARRDAARKVLLAAQARGDISRDVDIEVTSTGARFAWRHEEEVRSQISDTLSAAGIDALEE